MGYSPHPAPLRNLLLPLSPVTLKMLSGFGEISLPVAVENRIESFVLPLM